MINEIIDAVDAALRKEFGEGYEVYQEESGQNQIKPGFFISCQNLAVRQVFGNKYLMQSGFCIRYFPASETIRAECNLTAERMIWCLEYIDIDGDLTRAAKMKYEFIDGELNFYVNYDCYVYKVRESDSMEQIQEKQNVKK